MQITDAQLHIIECNEEKLRKASLSITNNFLAEGGHMLYSLWETEVREARNNILTAFELLLLTDVVVCAEKDIEFWVWKICFYNLVETLKTMLKHSEGRMVTHHNQGQGRMGNYPTPEIKEQIEHIIQGLLTHGMDFYSGMLGKLDVTYKIGLDKYYDVLAPRAPDSMIRCVLVSAQKCLLCLGDLARYKEQHMDTFNFGKARQYYQKACHIDTRNGRPFNQLAILAHASKRKFEEFYYHMRCLCTKSPVSSSRDFLTVIFEDVGKRWEAAESKRLEDKEKRRMEADRQKEGNRLIKGTRLR